MKKTGQIQTYVEESDSLTPLDFNNEPSAQISSLNDDFTGDGSTQLKLDPEQGVVEVDKSVQFCDFFLSRKL